MGGVDVTHVRAHVLDHCFQQRHVLVREVDGGHLGLTGVLV